MQILAVMLCHWFTVSSADFWNGMCSSAGSGSPVTVAVLHRLLDLEDAGTMFFQKCWEPLTQRCSVTHNKTCIFYLIIVIYTVFKG